MSKENFQSFSRILLTDPRINLNNLGQAVAAADYQLLMLLQVSVKLYLELQLFFGSNDFTGILLPTLAVGTRDI